MATMDTISGMSTVIRLRVTPSMAMVPRVHSTARPITSNGSQIPAQLRKLSHNTSSISKAPSPERVFSSS